MASEICPWLYLGDQREARNASLLWSLGITHILNVMESSRVVECDGFVRLHLPVTDTGETSLLPVIDRAIEFIDRAREGGGRVFLHCGRGQNRSPTIATAYLMKHQRVSLRDGFMHVRACRSEAAPHEAYLKQLQDLEVSLYGCVTLTDDNDEPISIQAIVRKVTGASS